MINLIYLIYALHNLFDSLDSFDLLDLLDLCNLHDFLDIVELPSSKLFLNTDKSFSTYLRMAYISKFSFLCKSIQANQADLANQVC